MTNIFTLQHKGKSYTEWSRNHCGGFFFLWEFQLWLTSQDSLSWVTRGVTDSFSDNHSLVNQMPEPGMPGLGRPQQGPQRKGHFRSRIRLTEYLGGQTIVCWVAQPNCELGWMNYAFMLRTEGPAGPQRPEIGLMVRSSCKWEGQERAGTPWSNSTSICLLHSQG